MPEPTLLGTRVRLDPASLYHGHSIVGRTGTLVGIAPNGWAVVRLDRRGRERKIREVTLPAHWWRVEPQEDTHA